MDDPIISGFLDRYFAGECTPAELAAIERWFAEDPSHPRLVALLREAWNTAGAVPSAPRALDVADIRSAWSTVAKRTVEVVPSSPSSVPAHRGLGTRRAFIRRSAVGARWTRGLFGCAMAAVLVGLVWAGTRGGRFALFVGSAQYVTKTGQRLSATLPDGTQFTLAPGSRLSVPLAGRGSRDVTLEGEAYFSVVHDPMHPFTVHARGTTTQDIGTRFDIRAYASDRDVRVAVAEGKVDVRAGHGAARTTPVGATSRPPSVSLAPLPAGAMVAAGDLAVVSDTAVMVTHRGDVASALAWTSGKFVFRATTLAEVAADLGRWYDVDITVDPALVGRHLVGSATAQSVDDALHIVAGAFDVRIEQTRGHIRILPNTPRPTTRISHG